jgi:uncharacterized protein (TIGR03067 family)
MVAAPGPKNPPKKDVDPLLGQWVGAKFELGGLPFPVPAGGVFVEFRADGKVVSREGVNAPEEDGYTADPKKDPAEIDIRQSAKGGPTLHGIYKVEGDTLTLCLVVDGKRPTKFESAAGGATILMIFRRAQKD